MQFGQLRRRKFITLLGAAAWLLATWAQVGSLRHIGVLMNGAATELAPQSWVATSIQGTPPVLSMMPIQIAAQRDTTAACSRRAADNTR